MTKSVQFSRSVLSVSLWPHGLQHTRPPSLSSTPRACSNSCPWVGDAIQPSHPLSSPSPPAFNLSQHQGLFKWVSSSHQVAEVLELQLQHVLCSRLSLGIYFIHSSVHMSTPVSQFIPPSLSPRGARAFVLYACISTALQIGSSVPFFWFPHICVDTRYLFFSLWLHSVWVFRPIRDGICNYASVGSLTVRLFAGKFRAKIRWNWQCHEPCIWFSQKKQCKAVKWMTVSEVCTTNFP